jgi:hypothetical protein
MTYTDTITLIPCSDWKISINIGSRTAVLNLAGSITQNLYVEARLNNAIAPNSSPYIPNPPMHFIKVGSLNTIPVQALDPEGDSLVYEWYQPTNGSSSPIAYNGGYSFTNPIGGTAVFNQANQTMQLQAAIMGKFTLAFMVKEYRGGTLVGYTAKDFIVASYNFATTPTIPLISASTIMQYNTCPGIANSITVSFVDSTLTDSVYAKIIPTPTPGFSFTSTPAPGLGSGSTTISWTTPSTFNPSTLPYFYINILARDNACPGNAFAYYAILVKTAQCNTDTVWAGDANADYTVNMYDPLAIAVAYNKTGALRPGATTAWQAQYCTNWTDTFSNGVNMKHADCNGNGTVDTFDLAAVYTNWGNVHVKGGGIKAKTTGVPDLYFDIAGINFYPGATVSVPIKLGNSVSPMNNMYGLASKITIGGVTLASAPTITYPGSWIGSGGNTLKFLKSINPNNIAWAYARRDHQNISGNGTIAMLNFIIPSNAVVGSTLSLDFDNSRIVNNALVEITGYNEVDTFALVTPVSVNDINTTINYAAVVPNPSQNNASLQLMLAERGSLNMSIVDMVGKLVYYKEMFLEKGENNIGLPSSSLVAGSYLIRLHDNVNLPVVVKWLKQ